MIGRLVRRANKLSFVSYQKKVPSNLYFQLSESSDMKYADGFAIAKQLKYLTLLPCLQININTPADAPDVTVGCTTKNRKK